MSLVQLMKVSFEVYILVVCMHMMLTVNSVSEDSVKKVRLSAETVML
jgi:hypothetical protein